MTLLTEIRRANVTALSKAKGKEWIVKWTELSGLQKRASTEKQCVKEVLMYCYRSVTVSFAFNNMLALTFNIFESQWFSVRLIHLNAG